MSEAHSYSASTFVPVERGGLTCEIHLVVGSHRLGLPAEWGYCDRRVRWWFDGVYLLCGTHKRMVEQVLAARTSPTEKSDP